ncbi:MAG TPA: hypothetical protein VMS73_00425 [Anaerolineaceae bacterium]|nr:hypothetical protein [Anaerolineaceae bacterium]
MLKKVLALSSLLMIFVLAACAAQPTLVILPPVEDSTVTPAPKGSEANVSGQANGNNALENRLAYGILKLEGTSNAVTADQAKLLLPLWQQIKTFDATLTANNGSNNGANATTVGDMQTVYTQIENALTQDQIQAIQQESMNQNDIQALMQQYSIQITPGAGFNGGNFPTLSPDQRATRAAQFQGTPGANGGRGFGGTRTPGSNGNRGGFRGMDFIFLDPLINLLQQRSGQ